MQNSVYDLLIVGAGPIGMACGIEAAAKGLTYKIIEKGCVVNSLFRYPIDMTFFSSSERLEIGEVPFISHSDKPVRREALDYYGRVAKVKNLNVNLYETVLRSEKTATGFRLFTDKNTYAGRRLVLATGFYDLPNLMDIPGENLPKVRHYFDEPHPYSHSKVAVVGAANSAVDAALETYRKGADVTMIVREPEIKQNVKYWVRPDIINRIEEGVIKAYFEAELTKITEKSIFAATKEGPVELENDFVFAMTGYRPDYKLLENCGVTIGKDNFRRPIYDEKTYETELPGLYLAGVICGGLKTNKWFIENSREHARIIVNDILGKQ